MRFGLCASMLGGDAEGIGDARLGEIRELGFDYVELPLAQMMALDESEFRRRIERGLERAGIGCEACNNFFPAAHRLTGPDARRADALDYARRALDRAARIGAVRVVFGSGGARNAPDGFPRERALAQLAELLSALGPIARERGIQIAIEPLNRLESNLVNRLEDAVRLAEAVGDDGVCALADWYHMAIGYEPVEHVQLARGRLAHVHIARSLGRRMPAPGDGEPYGAVFEALQSIGYDERISLEALCGGDPSGEAAAALALLRQCAGRGG